jgi:phosphatidylserine/phosphatidylglycerophosphate/cardiolipin synthase-like enzyme
MNQPLTFAAARRHRPERSTNLLVPGRNCWRIERARKLSWLVDGEQYFGAVRAAIANAQSTIFIVGWDIDSRVKLVPTGANDGLPDALGDFLGALLASRPQLNAYILSWDFAFLFALEREWLTELKITSRTQQRRRNTYWVTPAGAIRTALRMRRSTISAWSSVAVPPAPWGSSRASVGTRRQVDARVNSIPR